MTPQEFQINYGSQLKEFLQSPLGTTTIGMVHAMKPNFETSEHQHVFIENRGAIRGYELCIRNLAALTFQPIVKREAQPDYGVPDSGKEKPLPAPIFEQAPASTSV